MLILSQGLLFRFLASPGDVHVFRKRGEKRELSLKHLSEIVGKECPAGQFFLNLPEGRHEMGMMEFLVTRAFYAIMTVS